MLLPACLPAFSANFNAASVRTAKKALQKKRLSQKKSKVNERDHSGGAISSIIREGDRSYKIRKCCADFLRMLQNQEVLETNVLVLCAIDLASQDWNEGLQDDQLNMSETVAAVAKGIRGTFLAITQVIGSTQAESPKIYQNWKMKIKIEVDT